MRARVRARLLFDEWGQGWSLLIRPPQTILKEETTQLVLSVSCLNLPEELRVVVGFEIKWLGTHSYCIDYHVFSLLLVPPRGDEY